MIRDSLEAVPGGEAEIERCKGPDYTSVSFEPDLQRFGMTSLEQDLLQLLRRRAYDLAASSQCQVLLDGQRLDVSSFESYVELFLEPESFRRVERCNDRWQVAVALTDGSGFRQVSFVNSICTSRGGTHVNYVAEQVGEGVEAACLEGFKHLGMRGS